MLVEIIPLGSIEAAIKREVSSALRNVYGVEVSVQEAKQIPQVLYDKSREQYRAEGLLEFIAHMGNADKIVVITNEDMYYTGRNYVFGLAYLGGKACVISTYRLKSQTQREFSNKTEEEVFVGRVRKEVIHEVGHTLGLEHCSNNRCVMSFSPTVLDVDRKDEYLCGPCRRELD
jgi:archaemetzincin